MDPWFDIVGPASAVELFGIRLVGVNAENGLKLLLSLAWVAIVLLVQFLFRRVAQRFLRGRRETRAAFWFRQGSGLVAAIFLVLGLASIWFNDPRRLATALGLLTAALALSLQRFMAAIAGYFVILRGKTFNVGDRIVMGGVRGDVIALRLTQTTIMEMGQPPTLRESPEPAAWVRSREYTGRVVTVSNARIFEEPVYNYTRDFPYLWEEMSIPIPYSADRVRAEAILLEAARRHSTPLLEMSEAALKELRRRYLLGPADVSPVTYYRLTDNWLELTVRFIVEEHGIRAAKDRMSREVLDGFEQAGIPVASQTVQVVGVPPLRLERTGGGGSPAGE